MQKAPPLTNQSPSSAPPSSLSTTTLTVSHHPLTSTWSKLSGLVTPASSTAPKPPAQLLRLYTNGCSFNGFPLSSGKNTLGWVKLEVVQKATTEQRNAFRTRNKLARNEFLKLLIAMFPQQETQIQMVFKQQIIIAKEEIHQIASIFALQSAGQESAPETNVNALFETIHQLDIQPQDLEKLELTKYFQTSKGDVIYHKEENPAGFVWGKATQDLDKNTAQLSNDIAKDIFADLLKTLKPRATVVQFFKTYKNKSELFGLFDIYAIAKALQVEISSLGNFADPFKEFPILAEDGVPIQWITEEQVQTASKEQQAKWAKANQRAVGNLKGVLKNAYPAKIEDVKKQLPLYSNKYPYFRREHMFSTIIGSNIHMNLQSAPPSQSPFSNAFTGQHLDEKQCVD